MTNEQLATLLMAYAGMVCRVKDDLEDNLRDSHLFRSDEIEALLHQLHSFIQSLHADRRRLTGEKY